MGKFKIYGNLFSRYRNVQKKYIITMAIGFLTFLVSILIMVITYIIPFILLTVASLTLELMLGIFFFVLYFKTKKSFSRFSMNELEKINAEFPNIELREGFAITDSAFILNKKMLFLYPIKDIVWMYKRTTTTRLNGIIPVSKDSYLVVVGKDKKSFFCQIRNKSEIINYLATELRKYRKGIIFGYSEDLSALYRNDFDQMISISENCE